MNDVSTTTQGQCTLSYELLCLLHWLAEHNADALKEIIKKALAAGLHKDLQKLDLAGDVMIEDIQDSVIDFFAVLESALFESINEIAQQKAREKDLIPALDSIDTTMCDDATVRYSLAKVTTNLDHTSSTNVKEQLFKEILRQWHPHNETLVN